MVDALTLSRTIAKTPNLIQLIQQRQAQVNSYVGFAKQTQKLCNDATTEYQRRFGYVVYVDRDDLVHADLLKMLREQIPVKKQRNLYAQAFVQHGWDDDDDEIVSSTARVETSFSSGFDRKFTVAGHKMRVTVVQAIHPRGGPRAGLYFFARSLAARDALLELMKEYAEARVTSPEERDPNLYIRRDQTWHRANVPFRPSESVILAEGQLQRIQEDITEFLGNERLYVRRSIPWHRGYLFHGPPGTGKTSLVRGLAKQFGLDLWTVSLGDLETDSELAALVSEIRPRAILLLEDVDVYATVHTRQQTDGKASLSGLLNTLDGVGTPHGLITMMTTNHKDVLDPALLRPGRIDVAEELGAPTPDQARRLFEYFYEKPVTQDWSGVIRPSVAEIVEVFKRNLHDPDAAEKEITASS